MSKHSLLPPHATVSTLFGFDSLRLRKGYFTSDVVGLAIRYWRSYPSYLVACNSLPEDQRDLARSRLDSAYDAATWVLMREAYKIGLDSIALHEYGYLIKKLYLEDPRRAYYFQEDCYYWPDYIDERQDDWQSELPESEQAVLRNGVATFIRLVLHWESAKAAPAKSLSPQQASPPPTPKSAGRRRSKEWLVEAMLTVQEHPDWSDAKIAEHVGKNPGTLSRNKQYQDAAKVARGSKTDRPKGFMNKDPDSKNITVDGIVLPTAPADEHSDRGKPIPGSRYVREYCAQCKAKIRVTPDKVGKKPLCNKCAE